MDGYNRESGKHFFPEKTRNSPIEVRNKFFKNPLLLTIGVSYTGVLNDSKLNDPNDPKFRQKHTEMKDKIVETFVFMKRGEILKKSSQWSSCAFAMFKNFQRTPHPDNPRYFPCTSAPVPPFAQAPTMRWDRGGFRAVRCHKQRACARGRTLRGYEGTVMRPLRKLPHPLVFADLCKCGMQLSDGKKGGGTPRHPQRHPL